MNYCHAPAGLHQCAFCASVTYIGGNQAMINNWHEIGSTIHVTPLSFSFVVVRFQTLWILNKLTRHGVFLLEVSCDGSIRFDPVDTGRYRNSWLDQIHVNIFYALFWTDSPSKKLLTRCESHPYCNSISCVQYWYHSGSHVSLCKQILPFYIFFWPYLISIIHTSYCNILCIMSGWPEIIFVHPFTFLS